jgi:hypothetical protein
MSRNEETVSMLPRLIARFAAKALELTGCIVVLGVLLGMDAGPAVAKDDYAAAAQVQKDVRLIINAFHEGDIETMLRFTHPRIVELIGGENVIRPGLEAVIRRTQELGIRLESFSFPEPPQFFESDGRRYATIPTLSILSFKTGDKGESLNFQFGILEKGASEWKYVEGSRMNEQMGRLMFGSFPADIKFPQIYRKKLPRS